MQCITFGVVSGVATDCGDPPWHSGYDTWLPGVVSRVRVSTGPSSWLARSLSKCVPLWSVFYGPSTTEKTTTLELLVNYF